MTMTAISIPASPSFEEAIALAQTLMAEMEQNHLSEAEIESTILALVQTENGARGFFVTYLTDARSLADHPTSGVIQALRSAPNTVAELLVRNLAMSTAMAITHRRNQKEDLAQGSDRVQRRTQALIQQSQIPAVAEKLSALQTAIATGEGPYQVFLERWGYDTEQRQAIATALSQA